MSAPGGGARWRKAVTRHGVLESRRNLLPLLALLGLPMGFLLVLLYTAATMGGGGMDHSAMTDVAGIPTVTPVPAGGGPPPETQMAGAEARDPAPEAMPGMNMVPSATPDTGSATPPDVVSGEGLGNGGATPAVAGGAALGTADRSGAALTATVVGTPRLEIRSCPQPSCEVVATAPLGAAVGLPDQGEGGGIAAQETDYPTTGRFVQVEHEGTTGYASDLFLTTEPAHVPYLLQGEEGCKRVALIFNVGVGAEPATGILDTLKAERVPATMFVMGWWAARHPAILQRMVDEGYPIGSHGDQPVELTARPDDEVADDIAAAAAAIEHATGKPVDPYFTPYAAAIDERTRAVAAAVGYLPVAWTVPAADYGADATQASVYDRIIDNVHDGAIVELHLDGPASAESTGRALPRVIDELRAQGYRFVTIPEMAQPCAESGAA